LFSQSTESLDLERELARVVELSDLTGPILDRLRRLLGASGSMVSCFDQPGRTPTIHGGSLECIFREYPAELFAEDPIFRWNRTTTAGLFLATGDGFDVQGFAKSRAYVDFYRPHEVGFMCGVRPTGLPYASQYMFGLMFSTPSLARCFDAKRLDRMRQLEVPLRAAAARIARFRALRQQHDMLFRLLERQCGAFALWDADGRMVCLSPAAHRLLDGPLGSSDLEHAVALAWRQLRRGGTSARDAQLGRPRQLRSARGAPLMVEFFWIVDADGRPWLLAEIENRSGISALLMQLTRSEVRVLRLLVRGLSNREISDLLSVSTETVKTHVKRILSKLGVSSRAKAARVAAAEWNVGSRGEFR
jgi:DNA-binding CsgD family transcriptional regulator